MTFWKRSARCSQSTAPQITSDQTTGPSSLPRPCKTGCGELGSSRSTSTRIAPLMVCKQTTAGQCVGERIQRAVQWNAASGGSECGVLHDNEACPGRHQPMAHAIQPHPPTSGPQHASASSRNHIRQTQDHWHRPKGIGQSSLRSIQWRQPQPDCSSSCARPHHDSLRPSSL